MEEKRSSHFVVPNIVHLVKFGEGKLELFVYLNFLAIVENIRPVTIYLHLGNQSKESRDSWGTVLSHPLVKVINLPQKVEIFGIEPHYLDFAHRGKEGRKEGMIYLYFQYYSFFFIIYLLTSLRFVRSADIIRIKALREYGGIYLDLDTLVLRSFDSLRLHPFTIGKQSTIGLANGIMIANKDSKFLDAWYEAYRYVTFSCWDCHSVRLPCQLALNYPHLVNIVDEVGFLCPYHRGVLYENEVLKDEMYCTIFPYEGKYAQHLWQHTIKGRKYLHGLTIDSVCTGDRVYHKMLRYALNCSKWFEQHCVSTMKPQLVHT